MTSLVSQVSDYSVLPWHLLLCFFNQSRKNEMGRNVISTGNKVGTCHLSNNNLQFRDTNHFQKYIYFTGLSLRAGSRGFSPAPKRVAPGYFYWKIEEK